MDSRVAPDRVFEAIPEPEFVQMANLATEAGRDLWTHPVGMMQGRSRNWSWIRPWGWKSALGIGCVQAQPMPC